MIKISEMIPGKARSDQRTNVQIKIGWGVTHVKEFMNDKRKQRSDHVQRSEPNTLIK